MRWGCVCHDSILVIANQRGRDSLTIRPRRILIPVGGAAPTKTLQRLAIIRIMSVGRGTLGRSIDGTLSMRPGNPEPREARPTRLRLAFGILSAAHLAAQSLRPNLAERLEHRTEVAWFGD